MSTLKNTESTFVQKGRRTKSTRLYGLSRVDKEQSGGKLRHGWTVLVTGIGDDGKQHHLFPSKFFPDTDAEGIKGKVESRNTAMQYRDDEMRKIDLDPPKTTELVVRERTAESVFTRSKTRTDDDMFGISRDPRTKTPALAGWRVRVKGQSKHFSDRGNGGTDAALDAAKKYRNEQLGSDPLPTAVNDGVSALRAARIKAGISQDQAAQYMHVSQVTFARLERGERDPAPAFEELFCRYADGSLTPLAESPRLNLTEFRISQGKTQKEMSGLITGSKSQAPWASWETKRTSVPGWVLCYLNQIGLPSDHLKHND